MNSESQEIKEQLETTKRALAEDLHTLEAELRGRVEEAKETVQKGIEDAKDSLSHLSPLYQMQVRPWATAGGAAVAGLLVGRWFFGRNEMSRAQAMPSWQDHPAQKVGGLGLRGALLKGLANLAFEKAKNALPEYRDALQQMAEPVLQGLSRK